MLADAEKPVRMAHPLGVHLGGHIPFARQVVALFELVEYDAVIDPFHPDPAAACRRNNRGRGLRVSGRKGIKP